MRKTIGLMFVSAIAVAGGAGAQERSIVTTSAGVATTSEATSGAVNFDYGVTVRKNIVVFGGVGRLQNVEPSLSQPAVDAAVSSLAASNVAVSGESRAAAWYSDAGVRIMIPARPWITPYVFGAVGYGRTTPSARFTYQGTLAVDGSATMAGSDATAAVQSGGYFVAPQASSGAVIRFGGGVQIPVARSLSATAGYDFTRINTASPVDAGSFVFGIGVRF